jgi:hypothetical protein
MHHFAYRDGVLHAEDVASGDRGEVGTPFYCYSTATLSGTTASSRGLRRRDALVCYAMKANSNQAVLRTLARLGAGMDVVSEGELRRALAAGVPGDKIMFSGVGKTPAEMALRARRRHPLLQRRVRARARAALGGRAGKGRRRAVSLRSTRTSTPRPTPRSRPASRRTSSASRSQRPRGLCPRRELPGIRSPASTCISAARSPICSPSTTPSRCWPTRAHAARRRPRHRPCRPRRRPRHPLPRRQRPAAAPRRLCRDRQAHVTQGLGCKLCSSRAG